MTAISNSTIKQVNSSSMHALPQATTFTDAQGKTAQYFFKNNPWKFSSHNDSQKIFRFCVICGENRFKDKKWSGFVDKLRTCNSFACKKNECWEALVYLTAFVPRECYAVVSELDKQRAMGDKTQEFFEEIGGDEMLCHDDQVFKSDSAIPQEYLERFKKLEQLPLEMRMDEIGSIYHDHAKSLGLIDTQTADYKAEVDKDPYLVALKGYRQKCFNLLQLLDS